MSQTESQLQPLSLKSQDNFDPNDPFIRAIFEVLTWMRGDMRIGTLGLAVTLAASLTATFQIEPPDSSEEWEVLHVVAVDSAAIDVADQSTFAYRDEIITTSIPLQQSLGAAGLVVSGTLMMFPNRDTVQAKISALWGPPGFIVKRKDAKTPWLRLQVQWFSSATVGTRSIRVFFIYRRRKLI